VTATCAWLSNNTALRPRTSGGVEAWGAVKSCSDLLF
jgi:hypothetical protein